MAKRKELTGPGKCVYCLREFDELSSDHVIPESWYPESKPKNVELPQAPCCFECNQYYGRIERKIREQFGFMIDPWIEGGEGIGDKSLRSIDPSKAKNEKDKAVRQCNQDAFRKRIRTAKIEDLLGKIIIPNIGSIQPTVDGEFAVNTFNPVLLGKIVRKWVTGLTYHFEKRYVDPAVYVVQAKQIGQEPPRWLEKGGIWKRTEIGPGVIIERRTVTDDPLVSFWMFSLWGKLRLHGAVTRVDFILERAASLYL